MCANILGMQQAPLLPEWNTKTELELQIKPNQIEKTIFDLGQAQNYSNLDQIVQQMYEDTTLEKFIIMQLRLALFIADRLTPESGYQEAQAKAFRAYWIERLIKELGTVKEMRTTEIAPLLKTVVEFLASVSMKYQDLASMSALQQSKPLSQEFIKKIISTNFNRLFERYNRVKNKKPSGDFQSITASKKQHIPIAALEAELGITFESLEKKILHLGLSKNYKGIAHFINEADSTNILKDILLLQYTMALFIADRISFDIAAQESPAFEFPEQTFVAVPAPARTNLRAFKDPFKKRIRLQWLNQLLIEKWFLEKARFDDIPSFLEFMQSPIKTLHGFLEDIGYVYADFPITSLEDFKKALIKNFPLLFEPFLILKNSKASGDLQTLKHAKKLK